MRVPLSARAVAALPVLLAALLPLVAAAAGPSVTVTPSTALSDGQKVRVEATGFTPGLRLVVTECAAAGSNTTQSDCDLTHAQFVGADSQGRVDTQFAVRRGPFGIAAVRCDDPPGCVVSVTEVSLSPSEKATAPIAFAPASASGPPSASGGSPPPSSPSVTRGWLLAVPLALSLLWALLLLRVVGPRRSLPLIAAGTLLIAAVSVQLNTVVTASGAPSGVNGAVIYAVWEILDDALAVALLVAALLHLRRPVTPLRTAVGVLEVLLVPAALLVLVPAITTLGGASTDQGGGWIWYGAAAAAVCAAIIAIADLVAVPRRGAHAAGEGPNGP